MGIEARRNGDHVKVGPSWREVRSRVQVGGVGRTIAMLESHLRDMATWEPDDGGAPLCLGREEIGAAKWAVGEIESLRFKLTMIRKLVADDFPTSDCSTCHEIHRMFAEQA